MERQDIWSLRVKYVRAIKAYKEEVRPIVCADETYIHGSHTTSYAWDDGLGTGLKPPISKGQRLIIVHAAPSSFELLTRHTRTRPRGEGQGDCEWLSKNRSGLNPVELEDALAALPVDTDSHSARKSENDTPSRCSELREASESICVKQDMVEKQEDTLTTNDKRRGSLLQCLERCDSNSSFATSSPTPKRKISDYFTAAPKPK